MSTPAPSAAPVAVAPPYFRKSRRERLMAGSCWPLWVRRLGPAATKPHDSPRSIERALELHDVSGVERREAGLAASVVADDQGLFRTRQVGTGIADTLHPDGLAARVDGDDDVAILLDRIREAHLSGLLPVVNCGQFRRYSRRSAGGHRKRSERTCQDCPSSDTTVLLNLRPSTQ